MTDYGLCEPSGLEAAHQISEQSNERRYAEVEMPEPKKNAIVVPHLDKKIEALFELAKKKNTDELPINGAVLATELNKIAHLSEGGALDSSAISKMTSGARRFTLEFHKAILSLFGFSWPCREYYDETGRGEDQNIQAFNRLLAIAAGAIELIYEKRNEQDFPIEEMFTFRCVDESRGNLCRKHVEVSSRSITISDAELEAKSVRSCEVGLSSISMRIQFPDESRLSGESIAHDRYRIRDRSGDSFLRFEVENTREDPLPFIDDELAVFKFDVDYLKPSERLRIIATAPIPKLKVHFETITPDVSDDLKRWERLAENKVLERYRIGGGPIEGPSDALEIGQVVYKTKEV